MTGTLYEDHFTFFITSRSVLLRMRNISDKICKENQNIHSMFNNSFRQSCNLWDNVAGQTTDENMAYAHHKLDTEGHKCSLRICNKYGFFTATMVVRTRLKVTLHLHCLSCWSEKPYDYLLECFHCQCFSFFFF